MSGSHPPLTVPVKHRNPTGWVSVKPLRLLTFLPFESWRAHMMAKWHFSLPKTEGAWLVP